MGEKWLRAGVLVYELRPAGFRKGVEQFENRWSAHVQGPASEAEREAIAERLASVPALEAENRDLRAKLALLEAENTCDSCALEDHVMSTCMCGGTRKMSEAACYLRRELVETRAKLEAAEQLRETMDSAVVIYAKERDEAKTDNARLLEALYGYEEAFALPAGAGDALDRMCPSGWHHVDIVVRLGGKEHHWQGDWLKNVWYARKFARAILNPADEEAAMLRSALTKLAELNPAYAESVSCKRCGKIDAVTHGIDTSNRCRCPRVVTEGPRPPGPADEVSDAALAPAQEVALCAGCGHPRDWHEPDDEGSGPLECSPPDLGHCPCSDYAPAQEAAKCPRPHHLLPWDEACPSCGWMRIDDQSAPVLPVDQRPSIDSKCNGCGRFTKADSRDGDVTSYWCEFCGRDWDVPVSAPDGGKRFPEEG